jgi:N-acetylglucosaminyl-diphospho-decaprenol L-rhamnosyltransferase
VDLTVVVLSWNTAALTLRALAAAREGAAGVEAEVICVDNASRDGTPGRVAREAPWATLLQNDRNLGFARGNHRALPHARGRYLCFLNSDAAPEPGALAHLVGWLDAHPSAGVAAPTLLGPEGRPRSPARGPATALAALHRNTPLRSTPFGRRASHAFARPPVPPGTGPVDADSLMGACLLVERGLFDALGGFDEGYPFYWEDVDLCERARALGRRVVWVRDGPPVLHEGGASVAAGGGPPRLAFLQGLLRHQRKRLGAPRAALLALLLVPGTFARGLLEALRLALHAGVRALAGRRAGAHASLAASRAWLRVLERDALPLLRLLSPRRW